MRGTGSAGPRRYRCRMFRIVAAAVVALVPPMTLLAQEDSHRVVIAAGFEWSSFTNAAPIEEPGQTTTAFTLDDSGVDLTLAGEVAIVEWLGAGMAFERLSRVQLEQSFDVDDFRDFTTELTSTFDPRVIELYAAPSVSLGASARLTGMVGVGFWRAERDSTVTLLFEGDELSSERLLEEHDGTSLVLGAGVDVWLHRRVGVRAGYKYLSLSAGDIDEPIHNLRVLALFGF